MMEDVPVFAAVSSTRTDLCFFDFELSVLVVVLLLSTDARKQSS